MIDSKIINFCNSLRTNMMTQNKEYSLEANFLGMPKEVTELLKQESDRGVILILVAYLEEILGLLLQAICVTEKQGQKLLDFNSPAGDFDSKRVLCVSLGLISEDEDKSLKILQNIRNKAAHFDRKGRGFNVLFDSEATVNQIKELAKTLNMPVRVDPKDPVLVRNLFIAKSRFLAVKLYLRLPKINRRIQPGSNKEEAAIILEKLQGTAIGKALKEMRDEAKNGDSEKLNKMLEAIGLVIGQDIAR